MPRKPTIPEVGSRALSGDKALAVRDGLREVRFNVRHEAKKLVQAVEAASHRDVESRPGPLALLGEPLGLAVRAAASLLNHVEHAAVDLLAPDAAYRAMTVGLRPSASYFTGPVGPEILRTFTTDHHWRLRHWLALTRRDDLFVHEQEVALAAAEVAHAVYAAPSLQADDGLADAAWNPRATVGIARALMHRRIFSKPALSSQEDQDEVAAVGRLGAVVVVLAGEIASGVADRVEGDAYAEALRLADEIAVADRKGWEAALHGPVPVEALGRWFAFVLRHV